MTLVTNPSTPKPTLSPDKRRQRQRDRTAKLAQLIYETDAAGKPIYYAGYQAVLSDIKTLGDIMGASGLQSYVIDLIVNFLHLHPQARQYRFLYNEVGLQLKKKQHRACDIAIYQRERLSGYPFTNKYMTVAPDFVIEIDTKADLTDLKYEHDYFIEKTKELHLFGVQKVIWIFTEKLPVIWESNSPDSIIIHQSWDVDLTLTDGMTFNLARLQADDEAGL